MEAAGHAPVDAPALRRRFLRWQCLVRQEMMRRHEGRPVPGIMPAVFLPREEAALGHIITILNRRPAFSVTPELLHMARRTNDPADRRKRAVAFLAAEYYLEPERFSDVLSATFAPGSQGASRLAEAGRCRLRFEDAGHRFDLACRVFALAAGDPFREATLAHNRLFNPSLPAETIVLGFVPDWFRSSIPEGAGPG